MGKFESESLPCTEAVYISVYMYIYICIYIYICMFCVIYCSVCSVSCVMSHRPRSLLAEVPPGLQCVLPRLGALMRGVWEAHHKAEMVSGTQATKSHRAYSERECIEGPERTGTPPPCSPHVTL